MKLKTNFGTYNLELYKSNYSNNNKLYYGLIDKKNGEFFSDITVNINDAIKSLSHYNYIDWQFIEICFNNDIEALEKRLFKNLKIQTFGKFVGYYYFTI